MGAIVLCSGHHTLLHERRLTITGRAPDEVTFTRDGKPLVDPRSAGEVATCEQLQRLPRPATERRTESAERHANRASAKYDDVVIRTEAKMALRQLGYKAGAAKEAVERACSALGHATDVATIVAKALQLDRATMSADVEVSPASSTDLRTRCSYRAGSVPRSRGARSKLRFGTSVPMPSSAF